MKGKCRKLRYRLHVYNTETKKWCGLLKYYNLKQIAEEANITYRQVCLLYNKKSRNLEKMYKIEKLTE